MARLLLLMLLGTALAFNDDDNEHGYTGRCPHDWHETDMFCYKDKGHDRNFVEALDECTSDRDKYYTYWEQGARWVGPKYNLMHVEELHKLLEHGQGAHMNLGHGPYRVNAIKTNHDHKWREYDGGETDIDVYRWKGGREIDFSMFPEFDEDWGHAGDTLVWYPHRNKLYARPHYHKYDSLCVRRKEDAERCPGVPECHFHGDCYHGKCYCYKGYVGDDCKDKPKLLTCGGRGDSEGEGYYCELFDFGTKESCFHSRTPEPFYRGKMAMLNGDVFHCGGGGYDWGSETNASECWMWSGRDQDWIQRDIGGMGKPILDFDTVIVPGLGWWIINGQDGSDGAGKEFYDTETFFILEDYRDEIIDGPDLGDIRDGTAHHNCAVQVHDYYTVIIGGEGPADDSADFMHHDAYVFDWYRNTWRAFEDHLPDQGFWQHECEVIKDPDCGHEVIAIVGGAADENSDTPDKVWLWDFDTDEFYTAHDLPTTTNWKQMEAVKLDDETMILTGGIDDSTNLKDIYSYTIADGFTKLGEMMIVRFAHAAVIVWGEDFYCPIEELVP